MSYSPQKEPTDIRRLTEQNLHNIVEEYKKSVTNNFKWVSLENIKDAVLAHAFAGYNYDSQNNQDIIPPHLNNAFNEMTLYAWGLNPLGLNLIGHPYPGHPKRIDQHSDIEPIAHQMWLTPLSFAKPEQAATGGDRGWRYNNDFILSIGWENSLTKKEHATITIAARKPLHQFRIPGGYSPLYDALTGAQARKGPTFYTTGGEVVWSEKTNSNKTFIDTLKYASSLLKNKEKLDLMAALIDYK